MLLPRSIPHLLEILGGLVALLVGCVEAFGAPAPAYEVVDLFEASGAPSAALAINASGMMAGSRPGGGGSTHAFRLRADPLVSADDLGTLGGRDSTAFGI